MDQQCNITYRVLKLNSLARTNEVVVEKKHMYTVLNQIDVLTFEILQYL